MDDGAVAAAGQLAGDALTPNGALATRLPGPVTITPCRPAGKGPEKNCWPSIRVAEHTLGVGDQVHDRGQAEQPERQPGPRRPVLAVHHECGQRVPYLRVYPDGRLAGARRSGLARPRSAARQGPRPLRGGLAVGLAGGRGPMAGQVRTDRKARADDRGPGEGGNHHHRRPALGPRRPAGPADPAGRSGPAGAGPAGVTRGAAVSVVAMRIANNRLGAERQLLGRLSAGRRQQDRDRRARRWRGPERLYQGERARGQGR